MSDKLRKCLIFKECRFRERILEEKWKDFYLLREEALF